jgi:type II secretory pathway pseudopilin PulG
LITGIKILKWLGKIATKIGSKASDQAGIGLVEALVAIAILGITAATFMTALSAGSVSVSDLRQQAIAQELVRTQMETLKAADYDATGDSYPAIDAPAGYQMKIETKADSNGDSGIQKITVEVNYDNQTIARLENFKVDR